jgi:hypothetical protein
MPGLIPRRRRWLFLGLMTLATTAAAQAPWLPYAADCLQTLDGFNSGRAWAQVRITADEVRVLVQSDGEDWVFVELVCRPDGGLAEGARRTLPQRVTGDGVVPPAMLSRRELDAQRLQQLTEWARDHVDLDGYDVVELESSYVHEPRPRTVYRAVVERDGEQRTVEFDDRGRIEGEVALRLDEIVDAPERQAPGALLGLDRLTEDPVKVASYLAGAIGPRTRINRFIVDPAMLTVEWVASDRGNILLNQWMIIDGRISAPDDATPPNMDKVCAQQPAIRDVEDSLARLMAQPARATRIRRSAMLLLECERAGMAPAWNLLGGDGKLEAGVPLSQERFAF